jgi:hypothetical protein
MATSLLDELLGGGGASFGNPNIQRQGAKARALAAQRDVNTLPDPRTYAAVSGLFGTAPDEMGFSVLNPQYESIMQTARPAFAAGTALGVAPFVGKALPAAGRSLGPTAAGMTERYLQRQGLMPSLDVWHGTPHTLPPTARNPLGEFDASKIGTGEGAQMYGQGIYTAEAPDVAKSYQFMEQNWFDTSKAKYKGKPIDSWYEQAQKDQEKAFRTKDKVLEKDATARLAYWENVMTHNHPESVVKQFADPEYGWPEATNYAKSIDLGKFSGIPRSGNLYKVDLPDEMIPKMLDWDKPISKQDPYVRDIITKSFPGGYFNGAYIDPARSPLTGQEMLSQLAMIANKRNEPGFRSAETALRQAGIPGIKYLDEFSRAKGEGTRNFVTFPGEEKNMTILERNGLLGTLAP